MLFEEVGCVVVVQWDEGCCCLCFWRSCCWGVWLLSFVGVGLLFLRRLWQLSFRGVRAVVFFEGCLWSQVEVVVFSRDWVIIFKGAGFMSLKGDWVVVRWGCIWSRRVGCEWRHPFAFPATCPMSNTCIWDCHSHCLLHSIILVVNWWLKWLMLHIASIHVRRNTKESSLRFSWSSVIQGFRWNSPCCHSSYWLLVGTDPLHISPPQLFVLSKEVWVVAVYVSGGSSCC